MIPGDRVTFRTDPKGERADVFTVQRLSTDGEMVKISEIGFWFWPDNLVPVQADTLDDQLHFLEG